MSRFSGILIIICLFALPVLYAQEQSTPNPETTETDGLSIVVTSLDITDKTLKVQYEIINDSEQDIWIFFGENITGLQYAPCCETYIAEDGLTLTLRSSLEPKIESEPEILGPPIQYYGNYIRLRPEEKQTESISVKMPFYAKSLTKQTQQKGKKLKYATRLAIELEYYTGNTAEIIQKTLKPFYFRIIPDSKPAFSRNEELLIPEHSHYKSEKRILMTVVDNLFLPYRFGRYKAGNYEKIDPPDLASCVKIEFEFKPSILKHLFPYPTQQHLLSLQEKEYLDSGKIVITDPNKIKIFANDVKKCTDFGGIGARYRSYIDVTCYYEGKSPSSLTIYDNNTISIESNNLTNLKQSSRGVFVACYPETFSILKEIITQIQEIDFRMQCAANMEDLWYRLCFHKGRLTKLKEGPSIRTLNPYPDSKTWCDSLYSFRIQLTCPSAGEGKCHYAMNSNCDPSSPDDMVLLFETRAGWNQHGGPELFTFDNHNPRGGCVLLNNGTVKFIRTQEELNSLRWK